MQLVIYGYVLFLRAVNWRCVILKLVALANLNFSIPFGVVAPGEQLAQALAIAETIAAQAPLGVQATLASARLAQEAGPQAAMAQLLPQLLELLKTDDAREGLMSFVERRAAHFQGK